MPKEDNDKSGESLFPSKYATPGVRTWSGWYWYDEKGIAHQVNLPLYYNPDVTFNTENWEPVNPIETEHKIEPKKERYCFFLDIDGTLLKHFGDKPEQFEDEIEVLPGVREFFQLCGKNGHIVILTSGRRESFRKITEKQLRNACIPYDKLILGCTNAIRVLVNDTKPYREDSPQTAIAFNLVRDEGVQKLVDFLKGNNNGT